MKHLTVRADTQHLAQIGAFVQSECATHPSVTLLDLVITELAVNAIRHGHATELTVAVRAVPGGHELTFEDDGVPFDPLQAPEQPTGELREGGYGLTLVRRIASDVTYTRSGRHNRITLLFKEANSA